MSGRGEHEFEEERATLVESACTCDRFGVNLAAVLFAVYVVLITAVALRWRLYVRRRLRAGWSANVVARLRETTAPVVIRMKRRYENSWNPQPSDWGIQHICGPGVATYSLTAEGTVLMVFERPNGDTTTYVGPIPKSADPGAQQRRAMTRRLTRVVGVYYVVMACAGVLVTAFVAKPASSSSPAQVIVCLAGAVVGLGVARLLLLILVVPPIARRTENRLRQLGVIESGSSTSPTLDS